MSLILGLIYRSMGNVLTFLLNHLEASEILNYFIFFAICIQLFLLLFFSEIEESDPAEIVYSSLSSSDTELDASVQESVRKDPILK